MYEEKGKSKREKWDPSLQRTKEDKKKRRRENKKRKSGSYSRISFVGKGDCHG